MMHPKLISWVFTSYNHAPTLETLVEKIIETHKNNFSELYELEIVIVDDCSEDDSAQAICGIIEKFGSTTIKSVLLEVNHGQQLAISAGILESEGDYVIALDGDLQNPVDVGPIMIRELESGVDIVYTTARERNSYLHSILSNSFYKAFSFLLKGRPIVHNQLMLRAFTRKIADSISLYNERNRTLSGIMYDLSQNYSVIRVENGPRRYGSSSYSAWDRLNLAFDFSIDLAPKILDLFLLFSILYGVFACLMALFYFGNWIVGNPADGFSTLILMSIVSSAANIFLLGLVLKVAGKILLEVKQRPLFKKKK